MTGAETERRRRFDALFRDHLADVTAYCRWRAGGTVDAQDAVAEVFLIAWRRLNDVPTGDRAHRWLYVTARSVMANQARASARRGRLTQKLSAQPVDVEAVHDPVLDWVHEALGALSAADREVLLLAEWEGLIPAEIAAVMQCLGVTVRGRLHRARRRFRAAFEALDVATNILAHGPASPSLTRCAP